MSTSPPAAAGRSARPPDPERGLRGAMSAALILEAIVVLLAIPVARNTGSGTTGAGVVVICVLAAACIALCRYVKRTWFVIAALTLQALVIIGWVVTPTLGVMGIVFLLVWAFMLYLRTEYRRRLAAFRAGQQPAKPVRRRR